MSTYDKTSGYGVVWFFRLLVGVALLSGCTATPKPIVECPSDTVQMPITVGVYYDPAFRAYKNQFTIGANSAYNISPGKASIILFDKVFSFMFKKAVPVISRPPLPPGSPSVLAVIEPKIEKFELVPSTSRMCFTTTFDPEITYRFTLYSPEGDQIVSSTYTGKGTKSGTIYVTIISAGKATSLAMEEAAEKFMSDFPNLPQVQQWLRQAGVADVK